MRGMRPRSVEYKTCKRLRMCRETLLTVYLTYLKHVNKFLKYVITYMFAIYASHLDSDDDALKLTIYFNSLDQNSIYNLIYRRKNLQN